MRGFVGYVRMKIERRARWDAKWRPLDGLLQKIETRYWRMRSYCIVECFGDSHVKVFRRLNWSGYANDYRFRTLSIMGATAYGLGKLDSKTQSRQIFMKKLRQIPEVDYVLLMLGEIDAGFLVWYLALKKGVDERKLLMRSVENYVEFIRDVRLLNKNVIVCSVPLPTLRDGVSIPDYMAERREISVDQRSRTSMTLMFNNQMREECKSLGVRYLSLDENSLDAETGVVIESLINTKNLDHHYSESPFVHIIGRKWDCEFSLNRKGLLNG